MIKFRIYLKIWETERCKLGKVSKNFQNLTLRIPKVLEPHWIPRGVGPTPPPPPLLSHNSLDVGT